MRVKKGNTIGMGECHVYGVAGCMFTAVSHYSLYEVLHTPYIDQCKKLTKYSRQKRKRKQEC